MTKYRLRAALLPMALSLVPGVYAAETTPAPAPGAAIAAPATLKKPVLEVESTQLNLGTVQEGQDAVATFKLKNKGNDDLKILSAKPG